MLAAAGPPPDPHHHLLISTEPPGRSSSLVTQLMETPQISPMTAAWSPLTPSPCSTITYTCNRSPQAPKPLPSSVFFSCVRGVCSVCGVGGPESLVSLQWPVWCRSGAGWYHHHYPRCHQYTVLYCAPLYCTVLCCTARCSYYPFIYTIRGLRLFVCGECIIRPSCWCLGYVQC